MCLGSSPPIGFCLPSISTCHSLSPNELKMTIITPTMSSCYETHVLSEDGKPSLMILPPTPPHQPRVLHARYVLDQEWKHVHSLKAVTTLRSLRLCSAHCLHTLRHFTCELMPQPRFLFCYLSIPDIRSRNTAESTHSSSPLKVWMHSPVSALQSLAVLSSDAVNT